MLQPGFAHCVHGLPFSDIGQFRAFRLGAGKGVVMTDVPPCACCPLPSQQPSDNLIKINRESGEYSARCVINHTWAMFPAPSSVRLSLLCSAATHVSLPAPRHLLVANFAPRTMKARKWAGHDITLCVFFLVDEKRISAAAGSVGRTPRQTFTANRRYSQLAIHRRCQCR